MYTNVTYKHNCSNVQVFELSKQRLSAQRLGGSHITQNRSLKEGVATDRFHGPIELYIELSYMIVYCLAIQMLKYSAGVQPTEKAVVRVDCVLAPQLNTVISGKIHWSWFSRLFYEGYINLSR